MTLLESIFRAYRITNLLNGKSYIGITTADIAVRWKQHVGWARCRKSKQPLANAIRKYGPEKFVIEHIASASSWEDLCATEVLLIAQEGTFGGGYNATRGGDGMIGYKFTTRDIEALIAGTKKSYADRRELGVRHVRFGTKSSPEHVAKMRQGMKRYFENNPGDAGIRAGRLERPRKFGSGFSNSRKLTDSQVTEILFQRVTGATAKAIAREYGVSRECVRQILVGNTYQHVPHSFGHDFQAANSLGFGV